MKTVLNIILAFIIASFTFSCRETDDGPRAGSQGEFERFSFRADVAKTDTPLKLSKGFEFELNGNATSCNLIDAGCFYIYGFINELQQSGKFKVSECELDIYSQTSECELFGQFDGIGERVGNEFDINAEVSISCGTGLTLRN